VNLGVSFNRPLLCLGSAACRWRAWQGPGLSVDMVSRVGLTPNSQDPNRVLLKANPVWDFGALPSSGFGAPPPRDRLCGSEGVGCDLGGGWWVVCAKRLCF